MCKASNANHKLATEIQNSSPEVQMNICMTMTESSPKKILVDLQSFPKTIYEGLEEGFIMGNGLENISICRNVANSPLAQSCTAQSEDITEKRNMKC